MGEWVKASEMDEEFLLLIRSNITRFLKRCGERYDGSGLLLDIGPQGHQGGLIHFPIATIQTLDVNPLAESTYTADLCTNNRHLIPDCHFDWVVCTEVLEHTLNPMAAVREIHRILKPGGSVFISTPFNFRIHGPLPDCWRFTEHGLRALLNDFAIIELETVETPGRALMPLHYTVIAKKV